MIFNLAAFLPVSSSVEPPSLSNENTSDLTISLPSAPPNIKALL
ncbi:hypothetical protein HDG38_003011 [Paraburkholderia sp. WSM4177]|nr:hypothetical protein [Paraburkholderia sp. WSM4177]